MLVMFLRFPAIYKEYYVDGMTALNALARNNIKLATKCCDGDTFSWCVLCCAFRIKFKSV